MLAATPGAANGRTRSSTRWSRIEGRPAQHKSRPRGIGGGRGIGEPLDAYHLGFVLGPRVNAGGRVGEADLGARLLATDDPALAAEVAGRLDVYNRERREIEARTLEAAIAVVEGAAQSPMLVFAAGEGWHPGHSASSLRG